jgi:ribosomal protein L11 methyltransferase
MSEANWLEVSLTVDGELAEAVAEVLARFVPNGVALESTQIIPDPDGEGHPSGSLRVCGYLPFDDQLEETRRKLEEALWYLGRIQPLPTPEFRPIQETDWSLAWKQHYHPIPVGEKLIIVPAWLENPQPGRIPIRIEPGMAFGTGTHPTTQLCLEMIEAWYTDEVAKQRIVPGGLDVIDVGCGSGILSVAALKLGARRALGVDVDADAMRAAGKNARINGVAGGLETGLGSVAEIRSGTFSVRQAPLVLANILAPIIIRMLDEGLGDLVASDGTLVLSGILEEQAAEVQAAIQKHGLHVIDRRQQGDWVALGVKTATD